MSRPAPALGQASATLKKLVWIYFWLLLAEGALRKWVVPAWSAPLLVVRDPVAILIYGLAARDQVLPKGGLLRALLILASASLLLAVVQWAWRDVPAPVLLYGWHTDFLHLPLIFVIPRIFDPEETRQLGRWVLLSAVPMALLMALQFQAAPDAWINRTPGVSGGQQLLAALGKVRPPGTFSFITGPVGFFALVSAFLLHGLSSRPAGYSAPLLLASGLALGMAVAVSGSRALVISVSLVLAVWLLATLAARQAEEGLSRFLLLLLVSGAVLAQVELFRQGAEVLATRWDIAAAAEQPKGGLSGRLLNSLAAPLHLLGNTPLVGAGLGVGTQAGAMLLTGRPQFLLSEEEWGRVAMEMGPILGCWFILFRIILTLWLARLSLRHAGQGNILPLLLFGAGAAHLLTGQLSQPTTLGFAALIGGLCLAAASNATGAPANPANSNGVPARDA